MVYEVCRLEELTAQPAVQRLCKMLGDRHTDPQAVQAAVWHLNCDLSWHRLAARLRTLGGTHGTQRFFTSQQIEDGKRLVGCVERAAGKKVVSARSRTLENAYICPGAVCVTHHRAGISLLHLPDEVAVR